MRILFVKVIWERFTLRIAPIIVIVCVLYTFSIATMQNNSEGREEEKKKYDFKRDPQLDALLKRKQRMIEVKERMDNENRKRKSR